ncbi:MAG: bifunctional UDP-sugar hydrolase/5'-nucleotidase [Sandaracinaceae bacterium]
MRAPLLRIAFVSGSLTFASCGPFAAPRPDDDPTPAPRVVTISIVGTNDLHGHVEALPAFSGYLASLRAARAADGGAVVLLDGGDMFQGTLESNLAEGAPIVAAYAALGYDAVTIGNHEFDYGPVGDRATPATPEDDRRGALRARVAEAPFPFLSANLLDRASGALAALGTDARPVMPTVVIDRAGVRLGVIGVTTEQTLTTTLATNVVDLAVRPLADAIREHARTLRDGGADVVLVAAHAGGRCHAFEDPHDLSSCETDQEIMTLAAALAPGTVDVIVAGHTHQGMAHVVNGIAIVESFSYGRAFGRVDLAYDLTADRVIAVDVRPPTELCRAEACAEARYEGRPITPDPRVVAITEAAAARAAELRARPLGVILATEVLRDGDAESALGNLFTDLMRAARPDADVALYNGGGLRADLPAGPLTYGAFYEALPFDNRFAFVRMTVGDLARMLVRNASRDGSFLSVSGVRATLRCADTDHLRATLVREDGRALADDAPITVVISDFLATGGDGVLTEVRERQGALRIEDGEPMREAMVEVLTRRGGTLRASDLYDPARPRVALPGPRPVRCE